jgi:hypothetical protein
MKDLNMENYDFQDLLKVFKIDIDQPIKFKIEKISLANIRNSDTCFSDD